MSDEYMNENEVSEDSRIPVNTLRWYRSTGKGGPKHFKLGRRVLYAKSDVEAWIAEARAVGSADAK